MGCGARTGLDRGELDASAPDARARDAEAPGAPWVVFDLFDGRGAVRLYAIRADGTGARPLDVPAGRALYPTFTPDGAWFLYVLFGPGTGDDSSIVALDLRTRATRTIVRGVSLSALAVSPDRRTVAYGSHLDLRAIDWDGTHERVLVRGPYERGCCQWGYGHPAFARDPSTVIFATVDRFEAIGVDGTRRRLLMTEEFPQAVFPNVAVSPDGTRVAAGVACRGEHALRTWSLASLPAGCETGAVATTAAESVVGNQANNPAWGADDQIAFQQYNDVFVVDAAGGTARNLTGALTGGAGSSGGAAYPAWAPRGASLP